MSSVITRYDICEIACRTYSKALSSENLQMAFKRTGIFPLDMSAINQEYLLPSEAFDIGCGGDAEANQGNNDHEEKRNEEPEGDASNPDVSEGPKAENFFTSKVLKIKQLKSENKKAPRKTMSKITSGHCITEEEVRDKMVVHEEMHNQPKKRKTAGTKKNADVKRMTKKARKEPTIHNSQEAGPSGEAQDSEEAIKESDKCCVCKLYTPVEIRNSVSLIFTKWVACDNCSHWVHLIYCTEERVIRKGDQFLCKHCK
ncbi:hypothetical protein FSP39_021481 [Pinctada imbricata]|uniref:Uncharacterized protein n=1 Tax=Pinctada imbricata TaxID=66713 RepID=A0AA88XGJ6_PINIB|nr:hypothetical protein FSP39_021481 [Pinctada imbricata]